MNNSITGGLVSVEDGLKSKEEYAPPRKVKVELSFSVPEGGDSIKYLDGVSMVAQNKINELLGKTPKRETLVVQALPEVTIERVEPKPKAAAKPKAAEKPAPVERTKADLAKDAGLPANDIVSKGDELLEDEPAGDEFLEEPAEVASSPISDIELGEKVKAKNHEMRAVEGADLSTVAKRLRGLIAEWSTNATKSSAGVPQEKRTAFLKALKEFK